ncbi:M-phase phosphoprotein 6 [Bacillus rossius redtenbacheri]|uniref:M-phase phosphoprotein 6 n=1 Tax=Bacillus rossius redtenbacheri TaxID=93214 RepID=UPI002FDDEF23
MAGSHTGVKLSKAILDMKFMKRSKEKAQKEQDKEDSELMFSDVITDKLRQGASKFLIERSYVPCEDLIVGRLSFQGMNPYIERIMQEEEEEKLRKLQPKLEADVSEEEMANRYSTLVGNISNKFAKRSHPAPHKRANESNPSYETKNKKKMFQKPSDD